MSKDLWTALQELGLPEDLRQWIDERDLIGFVLEGVQTAAQLQQDGRITGAPICRGAPRATMTVLTYSYSIGVFASEEIEAHIHGDSTLRYLAARAQPNWHELRQFRRHNRAFLEKALAKVLELAWEFKMTSAASKTGSRQRATIDRPETMQRTLFSFAAEERVNRAVLWDSMAMDD